MIVKKIERTRLFVVLSLARTPTSAGLIAEYNCLMTRGTDNRNSAPAERVDTGVRGGAPSAGETWVRTVTMVNGGNELSRGRGITSEVARRFINVHLDNAKVRVPSKMVARWLGRGELEMG